MKLFNSECPEFLVFSGLFIRLVLILVAKRIYHVPQLVLVQGDGGPIRWREGVLI